MTDLFLEYNDACMEYMGFLNPGRIKFSDQSIIFKNIKSGRLEQIQASEIEKCQWIRLAGRPAIKIVSENGNLYRFGGFNDTDYEKLKTFAKSNWHKELEQVETSVRGWNYGIPKFDGSSMEFYVENQIAFEIPLQNVNNCTVGKNEAALEFHQNDDCPVSLMELRFHIPTDNAQSDDPVEDFRRNIMRQAGIIQETGKALAVLDQILCTTPRGRYDIKIYPSFLALHGKTFDYKIPISTILRLFLLPHRDGRRMFFVISLDPPIKQGQTRYHFLILEFMKDEEIDLELGLPEEMLREKYEGSLQKEMKGPLFEVVSRIMKTLVKKKITVPGSFIGHSGTPAVSCAFKSAAGYLYPLEKGFMYVHKPPMHVRQEEIACVNFARSDVSTRSFDFEIETKNGNSYTFTSIEKEEYGKLFDFVNSKKLRIKNVGKKADVAAANENFFEGSDEEDVRDHYAEKLKHEAKEKEEEEEEESDESEDEDYRPENEKAGSEPEEEFDSAASSKSSDAEEGGSSGDEKKKKKKAPQQKSEPATKRKHETSSSDEKRKPVAKSAKPKPSKTASEFAGKAEKPSKQRRKKDPNAPKKASTAYIIWLNENRASIKKPGMSIGDVAKRGGELWKELKDKSKWDKLAEVEKQRYKREMEEYKKSGGAAAAGSSQQSKKTPATKKTTAKTKKSDDFVATDDTSSDDDEKNKKKDKEKEKEKDDDEEESTPLSSDSGSD